MADVQSFHALGQRVSQLTYNARNRIGTGCREARDKGLSAYGAEIVTAMNRVGMAIDVSHCSERTCLDAFAASKKPVLITHSNCRAIADNPRCKSDAVIRAMAARGGVMGITAIAAFVSPRRTATVEDVLDHFDRVVHLAGIEHVGLGSDVDLEALDPRTGRVDSRYAVRGLPPRPAGLRPHRGPDPPRLHRPGDRADPGRQLPARPDGDLAVPGGCLGPGRRPGINARASRKEPPEGDSKFASGLPGAFT